MWDIKKYREILAENDVYATPAEHLGKSIFPSFSYYKKLFAIVLRSNKKVKQKIYDRFNWTDSSFDVLRALESVGIKINITGMENLTKFDGPAVFIGNHMSTLETMVLPSIIQPVKSVVYIIKEELTTYPMFGPVAAARHPICVGRSNPRDDLKIVMEEGKSRLQDGRSIIIFPQKTRSKNFDPNSFNSLGVKLAKKNKVPVIPLALISDAWGNGKFIKDFGKIDPNKEVHFAFGNPMFVEGSGAEEHKAVIDFISQQFNVWGKKNYIIS